MADDLSFFKAHAILASVLSKDWKPIQGPRGGTGAYDPQTGKVEYGDNAKRRIRMETSGRKVEAPYVDLSETVFRLLNGQLQPEDLNQSQLLAVYNHVSESIAGGNADVGYDQIKDRLGQYIGGQGMDSSIPEGR